MSSGDRTDKSGGAGAEVQDGFDLLEYPTDFMFKAMCRAQEGIELTEVMHDLVALNVTPQRILEVSSNASRTGKFVSISLLVRLHGRDELEAIYADISASSWVVMTL